MKPLDIEQELVDSMARGPQQFRETVERLVCRLLDEVGYGGRATDGVVFESLTIEQGKARGAFLVFLLDGSVQPLRVEFVRDASGRGLASGLVRFGNAHVPAAAHGSGAYRRMVAQILDDPAHEFPWLERFHRDAEGWHHEPDTLAERQDP